MLIELMLALAISFIVFAVLLEMYLSSQRSYKLQMALSDIQYNAQSTIAFLKADIHAAGRIGCGGFTGDFPFVNNTNLIVRRADPVTALLHETMQQSAMMLVDTKEDYQSGEVLIISDCSKAEIFKIKSISSSKNVKKIIPVDSLHHLYAQHAEIARFSENEYSVEKTRKKNSDGSPIFALFKRDIKKQKIKLADNISHLVAHFTVYDNGEWVDLSANDIEDWSKIVGVAIEFDARAFTVKKHWYTYVAL
jgi:type IV pilus assembly protein PilW